MSYIEANPLNERARILADSMAGFNYERFAATGGDPLKFAYHELAAGDAVEETQEFLFTIRMVDLLLFC
jgi:hypothetical protein